MFCGEIQQYFNIFNLIVCTGIREWFRWYKTPDGKALNAFGFDERALGRKEALEVIEETHEYWRDLVEGRVSPVTAGGTLWIPEQQKEGKN